MKTALINTLLVGAGGFLGAMARYGLSCLVQRASKLPTFPCGTVVVNMVGCLMIGLLIGLMESRQFFSLEFRVFVIIGILGGFTTFSTFGYETFAMLRSEEYFRAAANVALQVIMGLALVWLGYVLATSR